MTDTSPIILWFRRDLRLGDHPALYETAKSGRPVIPVFLHDEVVESHGAAPKWRLGLGVEHFSKRLEGIGARLILRRGEALPALRKLVEETGAGAVWWTRAYDPVSRKRDEGVKAALKEDGLDARSFPGHVLFEPWTVETGSGGFYKVYSPFWRAVKDRGQDDPLPAPSSLKPPANWPASDEIADWDMGAGMNRGAEIVARHVNVGEEAASARLANFTAHRIADYKAKRDYPALNATSDLSENLTYGEISARACWHAGMRADHEGKKGAEHFLKELVWRDFAYHLIHHTPHIVSESWREEWQGFPWNDDERLKEIRDWKRGCTGVEFVDAAMREMYVTGRMHNRARMIVASYLTKHLMVHWRVGQAWFEECLIDWDPASNALGWQWTAGSGPDAAPYFRVFNPATQAEKFDEDGAYRRAWIAEGRADPTKTALSYFDAIPQSWNMSPDDAYPRPIVALDEGRKRALAAYEEFKG